MGTAVLTWGKCSGVGANAGKHGGRGALVVDHVHVLLSIPPKWAVSQVLGFIKGKSAIYIARTFMGRRQNFVGQHFWARGYWVSTVAKMNKRFGSISRTRKRKISV